MKTDFSGWEYLMASFPITPRWERRLILACIRGEARGFTNLRVCASAEQLSEDGLDWNVHHQAEC